MRIRYKLAVLSFRLIFHFVRHLTSMNYIEINLIFQSIVNSLCKRQNSINNIRKHVIFVHLGNETIDALSKRLGNFEQVILREKLGEIRPASPTFCPASPTICREDLATSVEGSA